MILTCNAKRYATKMKKMDPGASSVSISMSTNVNNCTDVTWIKSALSQYFWVWSDVKCALTKCIKCLFLVFPPLHPELLLSVLSKNLGPSWQSHAFYHWAKWQFSGSITKPEKEGAEGNFWKSNTTEGWWKKWWMSGKRSEERTGRREGPRET